MALINRAAGFTTLIVCSRCAASNEDVVSQSPRVASRLVGRLAEADEVGKIEPWCHAAGPGIPGKLIDSLPVAACGA